MSSVSVSWAHHTATVVFLHGTHFGRAECRCKHVFLSSSQTILFMSFWGAPNQQCMAKMKRSSHTVARNILADSVRSFCGQSQTHIQMRKKHLSIEHFSFFTPIAFFAFGLKEPSSHVSFAHTYGTMLRRVDAIPTYSTSRLENKTSLLISSTDWDISSSSKVFRLWFFAWGSRTVAS